MRILTITTACLMAAWLTSASAQTPGHTVEQQSEAQGQQGGGQPSPQPPALPVRIVNDPSQTEGAERQQREAAEREKQDLIAQQSVASSTVDLVRLTRQSWTIAVVQTFVAALGTIAVVITIVLNRQSTNAAIRAAIAAERAASAAENALYTERAWLISHGFNIEFAKNFQEDDGNGNRIDQGQGCILAFNFRNSGRTPALHVTVWVGLKIVGPVDDVPIFNPQIDFSEGAVVGPNMEVTSSSMQVLLADYISRSSAKERYFVHALAQYKTTNSDEWRTTECTNELFLAGDGQDEKGNVWPRILVRPTGPQNSVT